MIDETEKSFGTEDLETCKKSWNRCCICFKTGTIKQKFGLESVRALAVVLYKMYIQHEDFIICDKYRVIKIKNL